MRENATPDDTTEDATQATMDNHIEPTGPVDPDSTQPIETHVHETELHNLRKAYGALAGLPPAARKRSIIWLIDALGLEDLNTAVSDDHSEPPDSGSSKPNSVTSDECPSPRDFMTQRKPSSQVERIACLTYYLLKYRGIQSVRSIELSGLNLEAAGQRFGNISRDIDNADRQSGFIVTAGPGAKQLTARGEAVVEALPDRESVKLAMQEHPYRQKRQTGRARNIGTSTEDVQ